MSYRSEKITVDTWDYRFRHDDNYDFCTGHHIPTQDVGNPYSEDGYCCWCGNGSWKGHMPGCTWADIRDGVDSL